MTTIVLYSISILLLIFSYIKDKEKTWRAVKVSLKSFEGIMPQFLAIILVVGLLMALLKPEVISSLIGTKSGIPGVIISAVVGSITIMPTFVAFNTADILLKNGAGYAQVAALVSTLTMVGIITYPMEANYIGKRAALLRNSFAFLFSFIVALIIGMVMEGK